MVIANYILKCLALVVACGYLYVYWLQTDNNRYTWDNRAHIFVFDKKTGALFQHIKDPGAWIQVDPTTATHVHRKVRWQAPEAKPPDHITQIAEEVLKRPEAPGKQRRIVNPNEIVGPAASSFDAFMALASLGKAAKALYPGSYDDISDYDLGVRIKEKLLATQKK